MIRECQVDVYQDMLEIVSEMTQRQDMQERDTTLAGGKELRNQASLRFTVI